MGAQPHCKGDTRLLQIVEHGNHPILDVDPSIPIFGHPISARIATLASSDHSMEVSESVVNTTKDDVLHSGSLLPEVLSLPPPITGSGDDAPLSTLNSKVPEYTYYDQIWVYITLEAFKHGISNEDFDVISNLQILERINELEKPEPIRLSLHNHIMTSEDENSTDSNDSEFDRSYYDSSHAPKGDKVTRHFLPHGVSSKARMEELIKSINHIGAHIIDLDATVNHVVYNVKDQIIATSASISSLLDSQNALSQRLTALEANQASILEN